MLFTFWHKSICSFWSLTHWESSVPGEALLAVPWCRLVCRASNKSREHRLRPLRVNCHLSTMDHRGRRRDQEQAIIKLRSPPLLFRLSRRLRIPECHGRCSFRAASGASRGSELEMKKLLDTLLANLLRERKALQPAHYWIIEFGKNRRTLYVTDTSTVTATDTSVWDGKNHRTRDPVTVTDTFIFTSFGSRHSMAESIFFLILYQAKTSLYWWFGMIF